MPTPLGRKVQTPAPKPAGPEWLPVPGRPPGLYRHRDPPHRLMFVPPYYWGL